jgi:hypothetical protein
MIFVSGKVSILRRMLVLLESNFEVYRAVFGTATYQIRQLNAIARSNDLPQLSLSLCPGLQFLRNSCMNETLLLSIVSMLIH